MSDFSHREHIRFLSSLPPNYARQPEEPAQPIKADESAAEIAKLKAEIKKLRARS